MCLISPEYSTKSSGFYTEFYWNLNFNGAVSAYNGSRFPPYSIPPSLTPFHPPLLHSTLPYSIPPLLPCLPPSLLPYTLTALPFSWHLSSSLLMPTFPPPYPSFPPPYSSIPPPYSSIPPPYPSIPPPYLSIPPPYSSIPPLILWTPLPSFKRILAVNPTEPLNLLG